VFESGNRARHARRIANLRSQGIRGGPFGRNGQENAQRRMQRQLRRS
jgi:hypothetical protein